MQAEPSAQRQVLVLADLDSDLARVTHAARSLPQHAAIESLMQRRKELADAHTAAATAADDLEVAAQRAASDLVPVRSRLERNQQRAEDGSVTDQKVLRGLLDETEHLKRRISDLEDVQLEAMGHAEDAVAERDRLATEKDQVEQDLRSEVNARNAAVADLQDEAKAVKAKRDQLAASLPEPLLKLYEKLRGSTGLGAARLSRGRCSGCQLELTVADLDSFRKAPANEVLRCAECDRILVRTEDSGL